MAENVSGMRPQMGASSVTLPVTFDYSGGRRDSRKSRILWAVIVGVIGLIMGIGIITSEGGNLALNIIGGVFVLYLVSLLIRFAFLKEGKIRRERIQLIDEDYRMSTNSIWGIYDISSQYPYYCRFRNGKSGLFIRLNKDVILGKYSESEYEHYEAIGDALNLAGASRVQICHLDYMDNVGTDERLEESFINLSEVANPDIKDVLTDMFSYLQNQMMLRVTTFDVYLFMWSGSDISAWNTIQRILSCFLEANYRSYHVLTREDLRELPKILYNLHDFSVVGASSHAFATEDYTGVVPIRKVMPDGSEEVYNKTMEQKREERERALKEQELRREELKKRKEQSKKDKKNKKKDDEEFDLFE